MRQLLPAIVLALLPSCLSTGGGSEPTDPHEVARVVAGELDLVVADLDSIAAAFPGDVKVLRVITSAKVVLTTLSTQARAYAASETTADAFRNSVIAARVSFDQMVQDGVLDEERAEKVRVIMLVGQIVLNHLSHQTS